MLQTLLIPPNNLTPNRPKGALVTEPSIRVEQDNHYPQIWSMEKLHNRLIDMRELYEERISLGISFGDVKVRDPLNEGPPSAFFEPDVPHVLLGIANVFLQVSNNDAPHCHLSTTSPFPRRFFFMMT